MGWLRTDHTDLKGFGVAVMDAGIFRDEMPLIYKALVDDMPQTAAQYFEDKIAGDFTGLQVHAIHYSPDDMQWFWTFSHVEIQPCPVGARLPKYEVLSVDNHFELREHP